MHNTYCYFIAKLLPELVSVLRYNYIECLIYFSLFRSRVIRNTGNIRK